MSIVTTHDSRTHIGTELHFFPQLSFVLFLLLYSYPALEQWKALVSLISESERVLLHGPSSSTNSSRAPQAGSKTNMNNRPGSNRGDASQMKEGNFGALFIRTFYEQLNYVPEDFFENELSKDSFLKPVVSSLFSAGTCGYDFRTSSFKGCICSPSLLTCYRCRVVL